MFRPLVASAFFVSTFTAMSAAHADGDNAADVARGRRLFLQCSACHQVAASTFAKIGPSLQGIADRPVASLPDYTYSADLKKIKFTWDDAHLDQWIERPTSIAPGTTMAFAGVPQAADRKAIIAYLQTLR